MAVIFLDRDGVICRERRDYVKSWTEFEFLPGALEAVRRLSMAGHRLIVVTNQSCINRGLVHRDVVDDIHARMIDVIEQLGGRIEGIFVCPHRPDEGCGCRKPANGLLLRAADVFDVQLDAAFMVGDQLTDVDAAFSVGATPILVDSQTRSTFPDQAHVVHGMLRAGSLLDAACLLGACLGQD